MSHPTSLPEPDHLFGYTWRPARIEDAEAIQSFLIDIDAHDGREWAGTLADTRDTFKNPDTNPETDSLVGFAQEGGVAAVAWVFTPPEPGEKHMSFAWIDVHPRHRGKGLGDFVLSWAEARARQIMAEKPQDRPHGLRMGVMDFEHYRRALCERHGFEIVRYFYTMRRDLSQPIAEVRLPEGFVIRTWEPALDRRVFEAFNESFKDHWGYQPASEEVWRNEVTGREGFRGDLSYVIIDGDEVAGFSMNYLSPEENERYGIQEAWIGELGVRRPWRKRGFATALLNQSMHAFKAEGMTFATLGVDAESPTGALGVYERVGFRQVKRSMSYAKDFDGPEMP